MMKKYTRIRSLVVVAEGRLTIFPSVDRIPRPSLSDVRRSTIDWQPHLSPEFQLLKKDTRDSIKKLSRKTLTAILQVASSTMAMVSKDISLLFADLGGDTADSVSNPIGV